MTINPCVNIFSENIFPKKELDEKFFIDKASSIFKFYLSKKEVYEKSCLNGFDFDTVSFDFLYCDGNKTHEINREYRDKDYVADVITFAIFADTPDEEKFVFDGEINLGEVIFALDKIEEEALKKGKSFDEELTFLISHGILHLLGFDHQSMEDYDYIIRLQNEALENLKLEG
ncbi:rRNA maturation RNase YbeY [bacterium]|nr:rRNA maturation RNase YbeY [bacterium]